MAGIAPLTQEFDCIESMVAPGGLRAATEGRMARAPCAEIDEFDPNRFILAGHISVLNASFLALDWLVANAR